MKEPQVFPVLYGNNLKNTIFYLDNSTIIVNNYMKLVDKKEAHNEPIYRKK